ncbi:MAG TPA: rhodanese-like domain-containing protein [Prolixibacteraceae bacterium]|jgi:rhodanese-related sulfurtransferase
MKSVPNLSFKVLITLVVLILLVILLVNVASGQSVFVGKAGPKGKVLSKYIEPSELKKIVDNPVDSIWIIDVRSEKAYSNGHIPTAKSFPYASITDRLNEIPKDKYLILYCTVGASAKIALKSLKKSGYKRTIDWGGLSRWEGEKEVN